MGGRVGNRHNRPVGGRPSVSGGSGSRDAAAGRGGFRPFCRPLLFADGPAVRVSVIIPTLNEAAAIGRAVERAWQAGADKVIVADGGSRDGTREAAGRLVPVVESTPGRGIQQNAGSRAAAGEAQSCFCTPIAGCRRGLSSRFGGLAGGRTCGRGVLPAADRGRGETLPLARAGQRPAGSSSAAAPTVTRGFF